MDGRFRGLAVVLESENGRSQILPGWLKWVDYCPMPSDPQWTTPPDWCRTGFGQYPAFVDVSTGTFERRLYRSMQLF